MPVADLVDQLLREAKHELGDEIVKELASFAATFTAARMAPETVHKLAGGEGLLEAWKIKIFRLLRGIIPNNGPVLGRAWHNVNEFVSDYFQELAKCVKHADRTVNNPKAFEEAVAAETNGLVADLTTLRLIESVLRDAPIDIKEQFRDWFESTLERRRKFVLLVSGLSRDKIRDWVAQHPSAAIPDKSEQSLFMQIRLAEFTDPELKKLLEDDMAIINASGPNQAVEFWFTVERQVKRGRIKSIDEFKDILKLPPPEAFARLGFTVREKTTWQRYQGWRQMSVERHKDSTLLKWSKKFREGPNAAERR